MTKSNWVRNITAAVGFITVAQGFVVTMPANAETITLISAILIYLASILTALKQVLSVEIKTRKALIGSAILFLIATFGGIGDLLNVVNFGELTEQWIRFGVTGAILILNFSSKQWFPTQEGKVIEQVKEKLS